MSAEQDLADKDLKRFMFEDQPANMEEICTILEKNLQRRASYSINAQRSDDVKRILFSEHTKREIAKHRPSDVKRKRGLALFGVAFSALALVSAVVLPHPLNWIMAAGCIIPFVGPLAAHAIKKIKNRNAHHRQTAQQ